MLQVTLLLPVTPLAQCFFWRFWLLFLYFYWSPAEPWWALTNPWVQQNPVENHWYSVCWWNRLTFLSRGHSMVGDGHCRKSIVTSSLSLRTGYTAWSSHFAALRTLRRGLTTAAYHEFQKRKTPTRTMTTNDQRRDELVAHWTNTLRP